MVGLVGLGLHPDARQGQPVGLQSDGRQGQPAELQHGVHPDDARQGQPVGLQSDARQGQLQPDARQRQPVGLQSDARQGQPVGLQSDTRQGQPVGLQSDGRQGQPAGLHHGAHHAALALLLGLVVQEVTMIVYQPFGRKLYAEGMNEAKIIHDLGTQIGRTNFEPTGLLMSPGLTILLKK